MLLHYKELKGKCRCGAGKTVHQQGAGGERREPWVLLNRTQSASICYLNWRHTGLDSQCSPSANELQVASSDALFLSPPVECEGGEKKTLNTAVVRWWEGLKACQISLVHFSSGFLPVWSN